MTYEEGYSEGFDEGFDKGYKYCLIENREEMNRNKVKHGNWIHTGVTNVFGGHQHKCSVCGYTLMVSPSCDNENYCCSCGAKMDGVEVKE